ncbi:unnamed protein product [Amaranthus hypochondriacus]
MGNCMETYKVDANKIVGDENQDRNKEMGIYVKDIENNKNGLRVKMVLTKEELQWLMLQLSNRDELGEGKIIEDVLEELGKGRKKVIINNIEAHSWKPSLDSITEIPEVLEMSRL